MLSDKFLYLSSRLITREYSYFVWLKMLLLKTPVDCIQIDFSNSYSSLIKLNKISIFGFYLSLNFLSLPLKKIKPSEAFNYGKRSLDNRKVLMLFRSDLFIN